MIFLDLPGPFLLQVNLLFSDNLRNNLDIFFAQNRKLFKVILSFGFPNVFFVLFTYSACIQLINHLQVKFYASIR